MSALLAVAAVAGCSSDNRAALCIDEAGRRLHGEVYRLDAATFAESKQDNGDGTLAFRGSVVLKPGTDREQTQTIECVVATDANGAPSRVVRFAFDWGDGVASDEMPPQ